MSEEPVTSSAPAIEPAAAERRPAPANVSKWIGLGVGAGIGSAAIAAALLYASRSARRKEPRG